MHVEERKKYGLRMNGPSRVEGFIYEVREKDKSVI